MLISAALISIAGIIQKKILFKEHSSEYLTVFCLLMFLFTLPFSSKITFQQSGSTLLLFYIFSVLVVTSLLHLIKAYKHMQLSSVEPLRNLSPLIVLILAYFILGEAIRWVNLIGVGLLIIGGYVLEATINHSNIFHPFRIFKGKYMHFILFSLLAGGAAAVLARFLALRTDAYTTLFFLFFFGSVNMLLIQFTKYNGMEDIFYVLRTNGWLVLAVVVASFLSDVIYLTVLASPNAFVALALSIRRLSTLFVTIVGGEIFHETRLMVKSIACLIMLVGVYFIII